MQARPNIKSICNHGIYSTKNSQVNCSQEARSIFIIIDIAKQTDANGYKQRDRSRYGNLLYKICPRSMTVFQVLRNCSEQTQDNGNKDLNPVVTEFGIFTHCPFCTEYFI